MLGAVALPVAAWSPLRRLALAFALAVSPAACGGLSPEDRCEALCGCVLCSAAEREECLIDSAAARDTASAYGCDEAYATYLDCELTKSRCRDERFFLDGIDCAAERAKLQKCITDGSSLR